MTMTPRRRTPPPPKPDGYTETWGRWERGDAVRITADRHRGWTYRVLYFIERPDGAVEATVNGGGRGRIQTVTVTAERLGKPSRGAATPPSLADHRKESA